MKFVWRGWRLSPLIIVGRYTLWLARGILFAVQHNATDNCYYIGWLIIRKKTNVGKTGKIPFKWEK
jgi:hypothetical protein